MKNKTLILTVFLLLSISIGNAQAILRAKPLRPKVTVVKVNRPSAKHLWIDGHWKWNRRQQQYVWVTGKWVKPKAGYVWVAGHWNKKPNGFIWIDGYWKKRRA